MKKLYNASIFFKWNYQKYTIIIITFCIISVDSSAQQNVGIGTATPHPSAILDITSTTQGLLLPRLTTAQRDVIVAPPIGLIIYNLTTKKIEFYNGALWKAMI